MDMSNDEIIMCYRQAKNKGEQIKILADRNVCNIEEIIKVLVEHGGYERQRISRAIGAARKASTKKPYKKPEIIPEPPKPEPKQLEAQKYEMPLKEVHSLEIKPQKLIDSALDVIKAEIEEINRQQYELDMAKADIYKKLWDMLGGVS